MQHSFKHLSHDQMMFLFFLVLFGTVGAFYIVQLLWQGSPDLMTAGQHLAASPNLPR
jgi:hypothetical protein